jgi:hypothetical protein
MYGDTLALSSLGALALPLNKTGTKRYYYSHTRFTKFIYNMANFETRCKIFQHPYVQKITVSKDSITFTQQEYTHYPKAFFSEKVSYSNYWPRVTINKNLNIITTYLYTDSLFVTHSDNSQEHFSMKSKHKTKPTELYDPLQQGDRIYDTQYACRNVSYIYLIYDSYQDYYYEIATAPMPYENKDGTFNSPADKPWSLIIIDSHYKQIGEIDMPDYLSKHDIMITPQGIAIQHKILTEEKGSPVYVIYKLEKR